MPNYSIIYGIWECDSEQDTSDLYTANLICTCDTIDQAKKLVESKWFKKDQYVVSDYQWEAENNGEKLITPATIKVFSTEYIRWFVLAQIAHNIIVESEA